jgi:hypothetical protein
VGTRARTAPRAPRRAEPDEPAGLVGALQVVVARLVVASAVRLLSA